MTIEAPRSEDIERDPDPAPRPAAPPSQYDVEFIVDAQPEETAKKILEEDARWDPTHGELHTAVLMNDYKDDCLSKVISFERNPRQLLCCDIPKQMCYINKLVPALWSIFCLNRIRPSDAHPHWTDKSYLSYLSQENSRVKTQALKLISENGISLLPLPIFIVLGIVVLLAHLANGSLFAYALIAGPSVAGRTGSAFSISGVAVCSGFFVAILSIWIVALILKKKQDVAYSVTFGLHFGFLWTAEISLYALMIVGNLFRYDPMNPFKFNLVFWVNAGIMLVVSLIRTICMHLCSVRCVKLASRDHFKVSGHFLVKWIVILVANYSASVIFVIAETLIAMPGSVNAAPDLPFTTTSSFNIISSLTTSSRFSQHHNYFDVDYFLILRCSYQALAPLMSVIMCYFTHAYDIQLLASLIVNNSKAELRRNTLTDLVHLHPFFKKFYAVESPVFIVTYSVIGSIQIGAWYQCVQSIFVAQKDPVLHVTVVSLYALYAVLIAIGMYRVVYALVPLVHLFTSATCAIACLACGVSTLVGVLVSIFSCISNFLCYVFCCCKPCDVAIGPDGFMIVDYEHVGTERTTYTQRNRVTGKREVTSTSTVKHYREVGSDPDRVVTNCCFMAIESNRHIF